MGQHARFAPSGAHRWIACPGSIRLSENIQSPASTYAMEGTALHTVVEHCLRDKKDPDEFIGMTLTVPDDPDWEVEFDHDHADAVRYCMEEVKRITTEIGAKGGRLELTVHVHSDCWGTVDVLIYGESEVAVIDFKFGRGKSVEAEGNSQLMLYGLGALKFMHEQSIPIPGIVRLVILQPRIPNPTREWKTSASELKTWFTKSVLPAFDAAEAMNAPCNPGEAQCQFCDANGVCTARADFLLGIAEEQFKPYAEKEGDVPMVPEIQSQAADIRTRMETGLELLTPEIAGKILEYQTDFDNFFKKVGEFALLAALDGKKVPGFKLVYGRSNRKWDKPEAEILKSLKGLGFTDDQTHKKKLVSPAQAEKVLGRKRKAEIADLIVKPLGKKTLVDDADSREEVDITGETQMEQFATKTDAGITPEDDIHVFDDNDEGQSVDDIMAGLNTGGLDTIEPDEIEEKDVPDEVWKGTGDPTIPSKRTKKYQLMLMGMKGGVPIKEAADALFSGKTGSVEKGLRQLNEREGYTILIHSNKSFTVKE